MLLNPTVQEMLGTLPPVERDGLLDLAAEAATAGERREDEAADDRTA